MYMNVITCTSTFALNFDTCSWSGCGDGGGGGGGGGGRQVGDVPPQIINAQTATDVIYERPLVISFIQRLRIPTPTSHYGNVFQNASRSQQARSAIAMSLVKHHDDACGMQPRESRDDCFRLASVSMAPQNVFFDRMYDRCGTLHLPL